jgi:cell division septal protein FtsQ
MSDSHTHGLPHELPGDDIPDVVLDELLVAFADGSGATPRPLAATAADPDPDPAPLLDPIIDAPWPSEADAAPGAEWAAVSGEAVGALGDRTPGDRRVVSIDADDDLPDAITLDGDPSVAGPVAIDTERAANRPTPHPMLRARRIAVRRAQGRRRLRWFIIAGVVAVAAVVVLLVLASPLFAIDHVRVEGARYADQAAIQAVADDLTGRPILTADLDAARTRLEAIPWVQSARVTMQFPNTVTFELLERTPLAAFLGTDGVYRVIDADGVVIALLGGQPADYPLITGILPNANEGDQAGAAVLGAAQLIRSLPAPLAARLDGFEVLDGGTLRFTLRGEGESGKAAEPVVVNFGTAEGYREKLIDLLGAMSRNEPGTYRAITLANGEAIVS